MTQRLHYPTDQNFYFFTFWMTHIFNVNTNSFQVQSLENTQMLYTKLSYDHKKFLDIRKNRFWVFINDHFCILDSKFCHSLMYPQKNYSSMYPQQIHSKNYLLVSIF